MVARTDDRALVLSLGLLGTVCTWLGFMQPKREGECFGHLLPYTVILSQLGGQCLTQTDVPDL